MLSPAIKITANSNVDVLLEAAPLFSRFVAPSCRRDPGSVPGQSKQDFFSSSLSPSAALISTVVQLNLPQFPTISDNWLPVSIPSVFKYSSNSFLHLSRGLPISLFPYIVAVANCYGIPWFCILQS
jgi:hypothetical protein